MTVLETSEWIIDEKHEMEIENSRGQWLVGCKCTGTWLDRVTTLEQANEVYLQHAGG